MFSVEMNSKKYVKSISISNNTHDGVLFEGNLGELRDLSHADGNVLEFTGENGIFRIDLTEEQLQNILTCKRQVES